MARAPGLEGIGDDRHRTVGAVTVRFRPHAAHAVKGRKAFGWAPASPRNRGKTCASDSYSRPGALDGQGDEELLRQRIAAIHHVKMDRPPGLVILPMPPLEQNFGLVGEEPAATNRAHLRSAPAVQASERRRSNRRPAHDSRSGCPRGSR